MIRLFRRAKPARVVPEEELARRLADDDYACACCGVKLRAGSGVIYPDAPFGWKNPPTPAPDALYDEGGSEILTENYARRDGDNLLRAYLPIPIKRTEQSVFIGVWCSLKVGNHARFRASQVRGDADKLGEMFSWLYSQLPRLTGPLLTAGTLVPYSGGRMPLYWITDKRHPFRAAQHEGMSASEILDLYEQFGRGDMVQHLKA